ncbi:MAG TPA: efflux RND transporter periplasmic adaptor subunit [Verrucomicrobiae bacterium]
MAKSKKRRKILVFSAIGVVVAGLAAFAALRKRDPVITVQTEKVTFRNLTELVTANGKIQPVVQVKISPEVSGEIIELPVKEGQCVTKGDLILKIKPDFYNAQRNSAEAAYNSSLAGQETAVARMRQAEAEFKRVEGLSQTKLVSDSAYDEAKASFDVAKAQLSSSKHQVEMSRAALASAQENLDKTTIVSPLTGTISKLNSEVGERVVGTATMAGTEVMTIADLNEMEARVDIGEMDVVLIKAGQIVRLDVDAFKDRKFAGTVTEIANSSKTQSGYSGGSSQEATKFEVKIRIKEKEAFRPGMSVTAEIETRGRTNVLTVPIASVTTRLPKDADKNKKTDRSGKKSKGASSNAATASSPTSNTTNSSTGQGNGGIAVAATNTPATDGTNVAKADKKAPKPIEVVFVMEGDHAKMVPVKIGISDDSHWEITEGLREGQEVVSGGFRAITRDLEDGKKIRKGLPPVEKGKEGEGTKDEKS